MVENSFVVNYLINLEDDASYSLVNNDFENQATLLVKDKNMTLYFSLHRYVNRRFLKRYDQAINKFSHLKYVKQNAKFLYFLRIK